MKIPTISSSTTGANAVPISVASITARAPGLHHARALELARAKPALERERGCRDSSTYNRVRLRIPPPSGLDLLASRHGVSGYQDRSLTETCGELGEQARQKSF